MIVKDGWFAMQRFLKPDISEDISNNRSRLSKAPSLSIVFSILNIAKHCLHVWFASPYLLSPAALPANPEQHRCGEQQHGRVPRPHGPLLQAGPGSARPAGHFGSVHLIYLLLSIYTILYYQLLFAAATPDLNLSSAGRYDEWSCQLWKYLSYLSSFLRFVPSVACEVL